jgi:hypothetical protein
MSLLVTDIGNRRAAQHLHGYGQRGFGPTEPYAPDARPRAVLCLRGPGRFVVAPWLDDRCPICPLPIEPP